jgi:alkylation response protein AidB-like acyl-CoA dehydrogenase
VRRHARGGGVGPLGRLLRHLGGADGSEELALVAAARQVVLLGGLLPCAAENIQIHGGIGFTWEHDAHLYFKRAKSSELMFGDPAYHRELLAQRLGF